MGSRTNLGYPSPHRARNPKTDPALMIQQAGGGLLTNISIAAKVSRLISSFEENSTKPFLLHYVTIDKKIIE